MALRVGFILITDPAARPCPLPNQTMSVLKSYGHYVTTRVDGYRLQLPQGYFNSHFRLLGVHEVLASGDESLNILQDCLWGPARSCSHFNRGRGPVRNRGFPSNKLIEAGSIFGGGGVSPCTSSAPVLRLSVVICPPRVVL